MTHLLDTNICSYLMRRKPPAVVDRLQALGPARVAVSVVTALELREGAELSPHPTEYHRRVDVFLTGIRPLPLPVDAAAVGGRLRAALRRKGTPIGDLDVLIAAHALALGLVLVTNNVREFARVPGLRVENWASST
ncbi:MAG: type II toxin-antitoxin system VapC family toxin [Planctomycetes bacterium]|nr:type II toxin-antitoxin system VapC family toxin [Planctomycetota bacterium]